MRILRKLDRSKNGFLRLLKDRKTWLFLVFFVISSLLWLLLTLQYTYTTTIKIKLAHPSIPTDIALSDPLPEYFLVEIQDKGFVLFFSYMLSERLTPIDFPFRDPKRKEGTIKWTKNEIEAEVTKRLSANSRNTKILSIYPESISVSYSPKAQRQIPIVNKAKIQTSTGYFVKSISLDPKEAIVYGNKAALDTIHCVQTDTILIPEIATSTTIRMPLIPPVGATLKTPHVAINIVTEQLVQKKLIVSLPSSEIDNRYTLRTFPSEIKVTCLVPESYANSLSERDIVLRLDANETHRTAKGVLPIQIIAHPEYVQMIQLEPEEVEYILEEK